MGKLDREFNDLFCEAERAQRCLHPTTESQRQALSRRCAVGEVVEASRGLYARAAYWKLLKPDKRTLHVVRGMQLAHPDRIFCGETAALVWGLPVSYARLTTIFVATRGHGHKVRDGVRGRPLTWCHVEGSECEVVGGVRVTPLASTAFDCLRSMPFPDALAVADATLRASGKGREAMRRELATTGRGRRGIRRVIGIMGYADALSESWAESVARAHVITQGFAMPELQVPFSQPLNPGRTFRVDMTWTRADGSLVLCEVDGHQKYEDEQMLHGRSAARVLADEQHREAQLTLYEHPILRLDYADLVDTSRFVRKLLTYGIPRSESVAHEVRTLAEKNPRASLRFAVVRTSEDSRRPGTRGTEGARRGTIVGDVV